MLVQRKAYFAAVAVIVGSLSCSDKPSSPTPSFAAGSWAAAIGKTGPYGMDLRLEGNRVVGSACGFDIPGFYRAVPVTGTLASLGYTVTADKVSGGGAFFVGQSFQGRLESSSGTIVGKLGGVDLRYARVERSVCSTP